MAEPEGMNELSLFTGAGGGVLGSKILGHKIIGYVEYEKYCQEIIKQRIADGILDAAPIFGDVRKFISDGFAESYSGLVDLLTAGFPCQPFSVAGKGLGESDPRNMWPSTLECIRIIRPPFVFLENVPGLLADRYMGRIFGDLAESGYDARWICLGADDVGANHRRKRLWILGWDSNGGDGDKRQIGKIQKRQNSKSTRICSEVALSKGDRQPSLLEGPRQEQFGGGNSSVGECSSKWWKIEPDVGRVAHGVAKRVDRLKAIGNGQVPLSMAYAFSILSQGVID